MITVRTLKKPLLRVLCLVGVTLVTTMVLFFGSEALHLPNPLSFAHAMTLQATCASTKGAQQTLCEQQNPVAQGCTQDAQTIAFVLAYTDKNTLLGEVDHRFSARCNASWVRTIAAAHAPVQSVEAIFLTGHGNSGKTQGTQLAFTTMTQRFVGKTPPTLMGVFHLGGHTPPINIPLSPFLIRPLLDTGPTQLQTHPLCAANPTPPHCTNQDPVIQGCTKDAQTVAAIRYLNQQKDLLATLERRYSPTCHAEWGRLLANGTHPLPGKQPLQIIIGKIVRSVPGTDVFSTMVFVPNLSIAPEILGDISTNGIDITQAGSAGLEGILPALPAVST